MSNTTDGTIATSEKSRLTIDEDWAVVLLGFIIIFIFLSGVIIQAPTYSWSNTQELSEKIFAYGNLLKILIQFTTVFVFAILASFITNKPVVASLKVFPALYIVSAAALLLEGNSSIRSINLEAVIFSLS